MFFPSYFTILFYEKSLQTHLKVINTSIILLPLELSEELQQLQEMARKFSREEIVPVAAHHDQTGEVRYLETHTTVHVLSG